MLYIFRSVLLPGHASSRSKCSSPCASTSASESRSQLPPLEAASASIDRASKQSNFSWNFQRWPRMGTEQLPNRLLTKAILPENIWLSMSMLVVTKYYLTFFHLYLSSSQHFFFFIYFLASMAGIVVVVNDLIRSKHWCCLDSNPFSCKENHSKMLFRFQAILPQGKSWNRYACKFVLVPAKNTLSLLTQWQEKAQF